MLEIIALLAFCRLIGKTLRDAGVPPVRWQLLTIALWFIGEFVGLFIGFMIFRPDPGDSFPVGGYVFAILGAIAGAYASVRLARRRAAKAMPDPTKCASCGYNRTGLTPNPPAPCPECGQTPAPEPAAAGAS